ncbi:hypothetical protein [uncultured Winogradskyella sp.]|uniref:hypothetical protein n=1 Tax=uncultured Winogradskyella sp. TaxID=395353 RepID=UPI002638B92C|nr:hypothetical protein [uncultured Winogradskyella sp.]|tara:strand:- start:905 stop:1768 length:864 start_codon:yes stop_codon:yes gene_type:complete
MKNLYLFILLCLAFQINYSQENYTINGEKLELTTEVEGELDLLWTVNEGEFRYFVKSNNNTITELKNSRDENKNYLEEYKTTLKELTNGKATESLKFRLYDLKSYVDAYNISNNRGYASAIKKSKVGFRLGLFGGLTNSPFVENPENLKVLLIGGEIEIFEADSLPRHSGFLQGRHTFDAEDFNYTTNEIALGYRYRIINKSSFSIYGQVKLAAVNISASNFEDSNGEKFHKKGTSFDAPFIFGIGTDIKIGKNGYITLVYGELFALFIDNQGNFSTDFSVGYKFNL